MFLKDAIYLSCKVSQDAKYKGIIESHVQKYLGISDAS